jgi:hypothetical protein
MRLTVSVNPIWGRNDCDSRPAFRRRSTVFNQVEGRKPESRFQRLGWGRRSTDRDLLDNSGRRNYPPVAREQEEIAEQTIRHSQLLDNLRCVDDEMQDTPR